MSLPILSKTFTPIVIERTTYDATGVNVPFIDAHLGVATLVTFVSLFVYSGTALVNLNGVSSGKFVELPAGTPFDYPVGTSSIWVKGKGGSCDVGIVAGQAQD